MVDMADMKVRVKLYARLERYLPKGGDDAVTIQENCSIVIPLRHSHTQRQSAPMYLCGMSDRACR